MSFSKRERADYNRHREHVTRELGINKNDYNRLRRVGQELHRASEDSAMGTKNWRGVRDPSSQKPYTEKEERHDYGKAFSKTQALRKKYGKHHIHYYHQGDPRGAALYAAKEKLNHTNYSSKGKVIY